MFKTMVNVISSIGKSVDGPTFLKEDESVDLLVSELESMKSRISDKDTLESISMDTMLIKYGQAGEKNVVYELKNSFIPMYILHGITIQHEDYKAQLDFVLITQKFICILETKKLNGDITINNDGDFIRHFKTRNGKVFKKEGMYSPISQNQRHVRILHDMLIKAKVIKNCPVLSLVVVANPKSIINHKYASKEIKNQIVKHDQLTPRLKKLLKEEGEAMLPVVSMQNIASFISDSHIDQENAFITKYKAYIVDKSEDIRVKQNTTTTIEKPINIVKDPIVKVSEVVETKKAPVIKRTTATKQNYNKPKINSEAQIKVIREKLTKFRLDESRAKNVKAYIIFNNKQLDDLIDKMPKTDAELMKCEGFGKVKVDKYGKDIISIICK